MDRVNYSKLSLDKYNFKDKIGPNLQNTSVSNDTEFFDVSGIVEETKEDKLVLNEILDDYTKMKQAEKEIDEEEKKWWQDYLGGSGEIASDEKVEKVFYITDNKAIITLNTGVSYVYVSKGGYWYFSSLSKVSGIADFKNNKMNDGRDIFSDTNINKKDDRFSQYGGSQMSFFYNYKKLLKSDDILKVLAEYFPNDDKKKYIRCLLRLGTVGCGYTASVNSIFKEYQGREVDFKKTFGFNMYKNGDKEFNYEPLILDFFLYCCKKEGLSDINEVVGNIKFKNGKYVIKASSGADGVSVWDYKYLSSFLEDKYHVKSDIKSMSNFQGTSVNYGSMSSNDYKSVLKEGKQIIWGGDGYDLYDYDEKTGGRGKICSENGGSHAMSVTDVTENGDLVVSSWGNKYILDTSNSNSQDVTIIDLDI